MEISRKIDTSLLEKEFKFTTSRSSGSGGQNVNKVNTKVTLRFDLFNSNILTEEEKQFLQVKLDKYLTQEGVIVLTSQETRTQLQNKEAAIAKFERLLAKAFTKKKARKASKPSKSSKENRISEKKKVAEKKKWRQKF